MFQLGEHIDRTMLTPRHSQKVKRCVIAENKTFVGGEAYLKERGIEVVVLDDPECKALMKKFIDDQPEIWSVLAQVRLRSKCTADVFYNIKERRYCSLIRLYVSLSQMATHNDLDCTDISGCFLRSGEAVYLLKEESEIIRFDKWGDS